MDKEQPKSATGETIQPEAMKAAIDSSGYLLEGRVAAVLEEHGFSAHANDFVIDPRQENKTLEIDVLAFSSRVVDDKTGSVTGTILTIECKNNSQPVAFFVREQSPVHRFQNARYIAHNGFPRFSATESDATQVPLHRLLEMSDWHHYCTENEIATQFCGFNRAGKGWKAELVENYAKGFDNLCVVTAPGPPAGNLQKLSIDVVFNYPITVFQGPIWIARPLGGSVELHPVERVLFRHSASVGDQIVTRVIDVVTESALPSLLDNVIRPESRLIDESIGRHFERLLASAIDQKRVEVQSRGRAMFAKYL
jgi:hypothetical protein